MISNVDKQVQEMANFAVNDPMFSNIFNVICKQKVTADVIDYRTKMFDSNTKHKFHVEVNLKSGPTCNKEMLACAEVTVGRPLSSECYKMLNQKPQMVKKGNIWYFVETTACDLVLEVSRISCDHAGEKN